MIPVIAIAAPVGGGKTSLSTAIASGLGDASLISYDHYEQATRGSAGDIERWIDDGARIDDLDVPGLAEALAALKRGEAVADPRTGTPIATGKWIVLETPLGREHAATAPLIDFLLWIDTPLDVALARKIREFTTLFPMTGGEHDARAFIAWLGGYLDNYLRIVSRMLQMQRERVPLRADVVLDGRADFDTLVRQALEAIRSRYPAG
ncbi:MAG: uridine kinase [Syntrophaceae bacterium]|nr:uridine kinase [Syntrophaceae bacterium]